jgi:hypothetical protein
MTGTVRALTCPKCGGTISLRAAGVSVSLVCEHCGSTLDATREDVKLIAAAATAMRVPEIALGARGMLDGVQWEAVGYLERSDGWVEWCEYLLFNPYEGYAFLVDDGRRFSVGRLLDRNPGAAWNGLDYDGVNYSRFGDTYDVKVTFVVGEFYWRVAVGEEVKATDYVRSGAMLSCEENREERTWTLLRMLDRGVAERAFGIPRRRAVPLAMPAPAPHEPNPYAKLLRQSLVILAAAIVALVVFQSGGPARQRVLAATVEAPFGSTRSAVVGEITLPQPYNRVSIHATARTLDNAWVDLDYSLVDTRTQESFDSYATAEYYHGRDSDGNWSEGNWSPSISLASIPAGRYRLLVEAGAQSWIQNPSAFWITQPSSAPPVPVEIAVDVGGSAGGNIVLAILAMLPWPGLLVWFVFNFEKRRRSVLE